MKFKDAVSALQWRKRTVQRTFGTPDGHNTLKMLAKFCRANETCFHPDARLHAVAEGRREVFLWIAKHMHLSTEQLMKEFGGVTWERETTNEE